MRARAAERAPASTQPALLQQIFEATAREHPDRVAIDVPPGRERPQRVRVRYAELRRSAAALAERLAPLARADALVAVLLPRDSAQLYTAQLAVLEAGAAFACLDPLFPDGHLRAILEDAGAVAIVTDARGRSRLDALGLAPAAVIDVDAAPPARRLARPGAARAADPGQLAYVIYTSGTTGRPKGVMIEHRSIANLVRHDVERFGVRPGDRIAQSSSCAYDSSIEEIWLALAVGATLVVVDDDTVRLGPDLVDWLARERISVWSPTPTLLRSTGCTDPRAALPELRLLYTGGEALPRDLADLWAEGRWFENGYGPTECTVTVLSGRIHPRQPIHIGQPVTGHRAWVLDAALEELPDGAEGELCIAGPGLARGYRNREEATAAKFVAHPRLGRIYRTGDRVRRDAGGDFEYLGRIDSQIKLRGYRIELEAVEAHLAACAGVRAAACRVQGCGGAEILVAHIVARTADAPPSAESLRSALLAELPGYMVPVRFAALDALPTGTSGKLDRRALPEIDALAAPPTRSASAPRSGLEAIVASAFARALGLEEIALEDDFFLDLGGDSLAAVRAVQLLREAKQEGAATVRDLYEARTSAALAAQLGARIRSGTEPVQTLVRAPRRMRSPVLFTIAQGAWLMSGLVTGSAIFYALLFGALPLLLGTLGLLRTLLLSPLLGIVGLFVYTPISVLLTAAAKRVLIGRYVPMRAPAWGSFHLRQWIVETSAGFVPWGLLAGTVFQTAALRMLGARIGRGVHIHRGVDLTGGGWDLLRIGDDATLCRDASLGLIELVDGEIAVGPVAIGDGATLETRAHMSAHSSVGRGGYLTALSWLPPGAHLTEGECWEGSPAQCIGVAPQPPELTSTRSLGPLVHGAAMVVGRCTQDFPGSLAFAAAVLLLSGGSTARVIAFLRHPMLSWQLSAALLVLSVLALPLELALQALALRFAGRIAPGSFPRLSWRAILTWYKTSRLEAAGGWLSGSLLWPVWLRLAGMQLGRGCEISTIMEVLPENVAIGAESFLADGIYFCGARVQRGTISVARTELGSRTFLGNHSVIPPGHRWPDDLFVGVATAADPARARPASSWFGHPAMELPRREVKSWDRSLTHDPGPLRFATRVFWEALRFALPAVPVFLLIAWLQMIALASERMSLLPLLLVAAPAAGGACLAGLLLSVVALKWVLLGRVQPGEHAFWSCWVGRWDFLYVAWAYLLRSALDPLAGTLFLSAFLRLVGMRIGRRVLLGPGFAQVVDPDMLSFEDDSTVTCDFQAHSFEDRVLKIDRLRIGTGASVGHNTVVFYGADIGDGALVGPNGVVMKHDVLPPGRSYVGSPARESDARPAA